MSGDQTHPPSARRRRLTADERRASILRAARREFARAGYHGASTASIARAADCSEPMLYKHFAGKQDLFTAVLEAVSAVIEYEFDQLIGEREIDDRWSEFLGRVMNDPHYVESLQLRKLAVALLDEPSVRHALELMQERHQRRTRTAVERGMETGFFNPGLDPDYVAWTWTGLMLAGCYREAMEPGGFAAMLPHVRHFIQTLRPEHASTR